MSYATVADVQKLIALDQLILLTDDEDNGTLVTSRVEDALETASTTIDSYIGDRYKLPFSATQPILNVLCAQIAGYLLHVRRNEIPETWENIHKNALKMLEKINEGKISLGASDPEDDGESGDFKVNSGEAMFGDDELEKY